MNNFLDKILKTKRSQVEAAMRELPLRDVRYAADARKEHRDFYAAVRNEDNQVKIIAEIKRASPSQGDINPGLDVQQTAMQYEAGQATAISVLTESEYFKGSVADLQTARACVSLPVLRKDFIFSDYQVYESAAMGADAVLIIARILDASQVKDLVSLCHELKMDALVEVHGESDLETISDSPARIVGINNRDLETFKTDIEIAKRVAAKLNADQTPIALSGINGPADIESYMDTNIRCFLVGQSIVESENPEEFIKSLKKQ